VASRTEGLGGVEVLTSRQYDQRGRVISEMLPHTSDMATSPVERYFYDHLDRVTKVEHADGKVARVHYAAGATLKSSLASSYLSGLTCAGMSERRCAAGVTRTVDESGKANVVITDHVGRVVRNIDGAHPTASKAANYKYGPFGGLLQASDNDGLVTSFEYDPYGRMLTHSDPDSGASQFEYNGFDEIVHSEEPGGARTFKYDLLGRRKRIIDSQGTTEWIYDQGVSALGRLTGAVSPTQQTFQYTYEAATTTRHRGLLERVEAILDGIAYPIEFDYDDLGRPHQVHYPHLGTGAPIVAEYGYDSASGALVGLDEVGGGATRQLWRLEEAYQGYLTQRESFGNGASTTYSYDDQRRWLKGIETTLDSSTIQVIELGYHDNGQMRTQNAGVASSVLSRVYEYGATGLLEKTIDSPVGGFQTTTAFGYDGNGNLTSQAGVSTTYDPVRPHLISTVGGNTYHYDANGNVDSRSGPDIPGGTQTFEWTPFDLPKKVTTGGTVTEFEYAANRKRVLRRDAAQTRYFATDLYQRVADSAGNTLEERFRLDVGGRGLGEIVRTQTGEQVLYFHPDHQGTVEVLSTGASESFRRDYASWGAPQFSPNDELTRSGFTGHQHDTDLGLIDMRGRIYDPLAGRFLTPDPIMQAPFWSQGLNRYSYTFNDPVNNVDPSGFSSNQDNLGAAIGGFVGELAAGVAGTFGASGGATLGGLAGGTAFVGGWNIYTTVTDPNFGGASAGSHSTVSLSSVSAPDVSGLQGRLRKAPDLRLAMNDYDQLKGGAGGGAIPPAMVAAAPGAAHTAVKVAEAAHVADDTGLFDAAERFWESIDALETLANYFRDWDAWFDSGDLPAEATAKELNQIAHVFPRVEKGLEGLVEASGGSELNALRGVQAAANQALADGRIVAGPNGILPGKGSGLILNVNGVNVQLIGGRVVDGVVELGSFVGL
jgi:RHS repeat-associated protein